MGVEPNYPRNQREFDALVASEEACQQYLIRIRWPEGFVCPACGQGGGWRVRSRWQECRGCGKQTSVTAGTIFHDTRSPLRLWFQAIWYVTGEKHGASALGVQRVLGLGSYHTAWAWLHRLRRAMVRPGRERLHGTVQVDETVWGGARPGKRGRGAQGKSIILVAVEHTGKRVGRVRLVRMEDLRAPTLVATLQTLVAPGSCVETDGLSAYQALRGAGYQHTVLRAASKEELLPQVHLVVSLLKRWLLGTHQGAVRATHLDYYLDEFTFRFNRRSSHSRGLLFRRVLEHAVQVPPLREADLQAPR
jgi:transposase-like protein